MNQRLLGLDLLRLAAVLMVLFRHLLQEPMSESWKATLWPVTGHGSLGVSLFFVLSGFLVSGLLFAEYRQRGTFSPARFYIRRAWKIYPPFFILLAFTYCYTRFALEQKIPDRQIFSEVFFLQNYFPGYWGHTWSLAVEEHFYLALPLILLVMIRLDRGAGMPFRRVPVLVGCVCIVGLALKIVNCTYVPAVAHYTHIFPTHLRCDALFFGVLLAYAYHFHSAAFQDWRRWRWLLISVGAAVAVSPQFITARGYGNSYYFSVGFVQEYLGSAAVLVGVLLCRIPSHAALRLLGRLGGYSYSIYLWHMATLIWITPRLRGSTTWETRALVYLTGAFVLGVAMAKLWETPAVALRDRWFPSMLGLPQRANAAGDEKAPAPLPVPARRAA